MAGFYPYNLVVATTRTLIHAIITWENIDLLLLLNSKDCLT